MLRKISGIILLTLAFSSCKGPVEKQLLGKWHSVKIEESNWDEFFKGSQHIIDTIGKGHTDAENFEIYGVTNMDSMRREMQTQYDSAFAALKSIETGSTINFLPDSVVHMSFPGLSETGKWYINAEGHLIINEINKYNETMQMVIHINHITPGDMKLVFPRSVQYGSQKDSSVVSFHREKN